MTNEELVKQFYDGDKAALHTLYEQNTGFIHETVNTVAKRYRSFIHSRDTLDDLFQIASLEFVEQLMSKHYDPDTSAFLTYIKPFMEASVRDHIIDSSSLFKLSHKSFSLINKCKRLHKNGKSEKEIADELGISHSVVNRCLQYSFVYSVIIHGSEEDNFGFDYITEDRLGENELHPDNDVYIKLCCEYLKPLFDQLSRKEQEILGRYFGVFGYGEISVKDISELMLMTPNAVNKSVNASLNKLKELYYKDSKLFYWRNANWGFKDGCVLYFKESG
ncbi:sigma-70 family RNA polymerase sigma factor [Ruminococcus flavefaciens]|uniref:sigma-70 family RNA polymerase sigma factor n=1 Tax=Ruminococcus flavefaciens TaxID=1265 RepID=UPI0026ED96CF|nr:hypothetical protein [Ruminococcus flavefaciens]